MSEPSPSEPGRDAPRGLRVAKIAGLPIEIRGSWLVIFALVLWTISSAYLPSRFPEIGRGTAWIAGLFATVGFFASLVLHELAHSVVARYYGIRVSGVTLFLFGGVSRIEAEPADPWIELRMAIVGPLTSFALALGFWLGALSARNTGDAVPRAVLEYLAGINVALGVFNLIPGLPLDGGRVLRALVWLRTGSQERATRVASHLGRGFSLGLVGLGLIEIVAGSLVGGLWLVLIGFFLRATAGASYQELVLRNALSGIDVRDVMVREPLTVSPDLTLRELIDGHFLRDGVRGYPVRDGDKVLGSISLRELRVLPREQLDSRRVRDVMLPLDARISVRSSDPLLGALRRMVSDDRAQLLVMDGDRLAGLLTRGAVRRVLEIHRLVGPSTA
jgi:Zn-dependent protease/CBS domain-containing protein